MLSLEDAVNCWLQENRPTLVAKAVHFEYDQRAGFRELTVIYQKRSGDWILTFWPDGLINTASAKLKWSVGSPASPEFFDRVNVALVRLLEGDLK